MTNFHSQNEGQTTAFSSDSCYIKMVWLSDEYKHVFIQVLLFLWQLAHCIGPLFYWWLRKQWNLHDTTKLQLQKRNEELSLELSYSSEIH